MQMLRVNSADQGKQACGSQGSCLPFEHGEFSVVLYHTHQTFGKNKAQDDYLSITAQLVNRKARIGFQVFC